jgi:hypothetical protein
MRRFLGPLLRLSLAAPLLVSITMAGCAAALPPAGKWWGTVTVPSGSSALAWMIKEDGSYEGTSSGGITQFDGNVFLRQGKILWLTRTTGRSGTMTLHEGEGRRVLSGRPDDGSITFTLTPVQ